MWVLVVLGFIVDDSMSATTTCAFSSSSLLSAIWWVTISGSPDGIGWLLVVDLFLAECIQSWRTPIEPQLHLLLSVFMGVFFLAILLRYGDVFFTCVREIMVEFGLFLVG